MSLLSIIQKPGLRLFLARKEILRAGAAIALAALVIGLTISGAKQRGMHHRVMVSPGEQIAISIALSETVYGLKLGYVGHTRVLDAIQAHWNKGDDGWSNLPVLIENFGNRQVLNEGIRAAASLGPQKTGYFTDGSLISTIYDDMGEVDYYKLSFKIFGMKIESAFYMFFALLGLSAISFILTFRNNVYALCVLLCTLFAFYLELHLAFFDFVATPTYFGMRHSSTLGLVPMWYFAFLLVFPRTMSPAQVAGALLQVAILILAWRIRASVTWVFMFLFLLTAFLTLHRFWPARLDGKRSWSIANRPWLEWARRWPEFLSDALRWPIVLLLLGMFANAAYNQQSRHLIYSTDDVIPYHGLWWSGVNALYWKKPELFGERVKNTAGTPEGWWHVRDYLDRNHLVPWSGTYLMTEPAPGLLSPWTGGGLKYRLVDETMKRLYLEALTKKPRVSARFYLIEQPLRITNTLMDPFRNAKSNTWIWLTLLAVAGVFAFALRFEDGGASPPPGVVVTLCFGAFMAALLPGIWAHAVGPYLPDAILLSVCFVSLALGLGAYRLFKGARPAMASE